MINPERLTTGARNMLVVCAGLGDGQRLLIVHEDPALGWYTEGLAATVAAEAAELGAEVTMLQVGGPENDRDPAVGIAVDDNDIVIFLARIGDQERFSDPVSGKTVVMCYARDREMLASAYGRTNYQAFIALKNAVNDVLLNADQIEITCPLGTAISGALTPAARASREDVTVRRFPLGVPQPIDASTFSGRVALAHFLTPTGSKVYEPASLALAGPVFAEVKNGRIDAFTGNEDVVAQVREHYRQVSDYLDIQWDVVHSWHAGIHPASAYDRTAAENPDRWSNTIFTNPRFLHFHTCGTYPPGEICWMLLDHTVNVDGRELWRNGRFQPQNFSDLRQVLETWDELRVIFEAPSDILGI
jgi:hypothetical protein